MDKDAIAEAYDDVRNDNTETMWAVIKYDGPDLVLESTGSEYDELLSKFTPDERAFAFLRVITGDEMSRRAKFVLISWIGRDVSPLKRAKMSTDKNLHIKSVITSVAVDIQASEADELTEECIQAEVAKAGGANYGTGVRD